MPKLQVLACPSCGASLSIEEGEAAAQCQFCGNTVVVPEELRRPKPDAPPTPASASGIRVGGIPFLDQLPRLREMGDMVRAGRREEAAQVYRQLFGTSEAEARQAVDLMAAGQPVTVQHVSTSVGAAEDSGVFRLDGSGRPQFQVGTLNTVGPNVVTGTPMAGSYTGAPVVIRSGGGGRMAGCVISIVVLSVVGSIAIGALAMLGGFLPMLAIPGVGDVISSVTNQYPRVVLEFGGEGTGPGFLPDARYVAVDGDGNIYVAEFTGGQVQVFNTAGEYQTRWAPEADGDIYVTGMTVSRAGDVYLVYGSDLYQFDGLSDELIRQLAYVDGWGFSDVATLPDGGVAATWYKNRDDLIIYDGEGEVVTSVEAVISGITGDLEPSVKLAADGSGDLFLVGNLAEAVFHFSAEGEYQNRFGSAGDEAGQFRAIGDIVIDKQGRLYISDIKGIQVFEPDGRYVSTIRPPGLTYAYGMAIADDNRLYVVSDGKVIKYQLAAEE